MAMEVYDVGPDTGVKKPIRFVSKQYLRKVESVAEFVERCIKVWHDNDPFEAEAFYRAMDEYNKAQDGNAMSKGGSMMIWGKVPPDLFRLIESADRTFWHDQDKAILFFSIFKRARVNHTPRKVVIA